MMEWGKVPQMPFSGNAGGAWNDRRDDRRDEDSASTLQESAAERPRQEDEMMP